MLPPPQPQACRSSPRGGAGRGRLHLRHFHLGCRGARVLSSLSGDPRTGGSAVALPGTPGSRRSQGSREVLEWPGAGGLCPRGPIPADPLGKNCPFPFAFFLPRKSGAAATLRGSTRCRSFLCPHRSTRSAGERNVPGVPSCAALTASEPHRAGARSGQSGSGSVGDTVPLREQLSPLKSPLEALRPKLGEQQHWVGGIARTSSPLGSRFVPCGPPSDCDRRARG